MVSSVDPASVREDFRCYLCRQKGVFHCEHDTPYRDQYLGTYDPTKPHVSSPTSRKEQSRGSIKSQGNSLSNGREKHTDGDGGVGRGGAKHHIGAQDHHNMKSDKKSGVAKDPHGSTKASDQNKNSKSCVIL